MHKNQDRISQVEATPIAVTDPPLLNAAGLHASYALRIIVEIHTESGLTGISEIPGNVDILSSLEKTASILQGVNPFELNRIQDLLLTLDLSESQNQRGSTPWDQRTRVHIFSAVEVACLDIIGKALGVSVVDLLGGKVRDKVPFAAYLFYKYEGAGGELEMGIDPQANAWAKARQKSALNPDEIVAQAKAMQEYFGFESIKLKGGVFEPALEVDSILALREAFGSQIPLRFDPNAIWSFETALKWGKKMKGVLEYFEDPVRGQKQMARLRQALDMPFATNMCTTSFSDIPKSVALHSEDIILSDHHFWGGMRACMELYRMCQTFGRGFSMHSNSHLGISLAGMVHIGAAISSIDFALDTHYPWQEEEVIIGGKLPIVDGCVQVPDGPGLGVEIDREQLKRLHQNYLNCGLSRRDDESEMQKVHPDWKFMETRY